MEVKNDDINCRLTAALTNLSDLRLEALEGKTVLVVDDEASQVRIAEKYLQSFARSCNVIGANSAQDATKKIEEGLQPDVIISDIMMPGGTGKDLYDTLGKMDRQDLADRIIFVSGGAPIGFTRLKEFYQNIKNQGRLVEKPLDKEKLAELREHIILILKGSAQQEKESPAKSESADNGEAEERRMIAERIGHGFNNPLTVIMVNICILKDRLSEKRELTEDERDMINDVIGSGKRLKQLIVRLKADIIEGKIPFKTEKEGQ